MCTVSATPSSWYTSRKKPCRCGYSWIWFTLHLKWVWYTWSNRTSVWNSRITDAAGNTGQDDAYYNIDRTPPDIACDHRDDGAGCHRPEPVLIGNDIRFTPQTTDQNAGINHTVICRDSGCVGTYCAYPATDSSCTYTASFVQEYPYDNHEYCIHVRDNAGNTNTTCDQYFTSKGGPGDPCDGDNECGLGICDSNLCITEGMEGPDLKLH